MCCIPLHSVVPSVFTVFAADCEERRWKWNWGGRSQVQLLVHTPHAAVLVLPWWTDVLFLTCPWLRLLWKGWGDLEPRLVEMLWNFPAASESQGKNMCGGGASDLSWVGCISLKVRGTGSPLSTLWSGPLTPPLPFLSMTSWMGRRRRGQCLPLYGISIGMGACPLSRTVSNRKTQWCHCFWEGMPWFAMKDELVHTIHPSFKQKNL